MNRIGTEHRWRDRSSRRMSWLWFSCLALLLLLPPVSFAKTHLWKYRPFRANDTDHSGGDHICDLRRDSNADGKPDRLGEYVTLSGTVIVEPSTFETGGWLFWIREGGCGILVYGEQENLQLGDSVTIKGWVRLSNGNYFFPETGLASLGDIALENGGLTLIAGQGEHQPTGTQPEDYAASPRGSGGDLLTLTRPVRVSRVISLDGDELAWGSCGCDSLPVYLDGDTHCSLVCSRCYLITGVVASMKMPSGYVPASAWCVVPRSPADIIEVGCSTDCRPVSWGYLKTEYDR